MVTSVAIYNKSYCNIKSKSMWVCETRVAELKVKHHAMKMFCGVEVYPQNFSPP
jgi:hypothetical protein